MSTLDQFLARSSPRHTRPSHPPRLECSPLVLDARALENPAAPPISSLLYSGFIEHMGRCIYGGILDDPASPSPSSFLLARPEGHLGWRKDVINVIGGPGKGELECPMIRWPGGNFVSNYHWKDGIGGQGDRRARQELAWKGMETNR